MYTYTCIHTHADTHTHTQKHIHTCTHTHVNTHTHTHTLIIMYIVKSSGALRTLLLNVKTRSSDLKKVVHRTPCRDSDVAYIGETGRSIPEEGNSGT